MDEISTKSTRNLPRDLLVDSRKLINLLINRNDDTRRVQCFKLKKNSLVVVQGGTVTSEIYFSMKIQGRARGEENDCTVKDKGIM